MHCSVCLCDGCFETIHCFIDLKVVSAAGFEPASYLVRLVTQWTLVSALNKNVSWSYLTNIIHDWLDLNRLYHSATRSNCFTAKQAQDLRCEESDIFHCFHRHDQ